MTVNELNDKLRDIFKSKLDNGYTKSNICSLVLGTSGFAQFENFITDDKTFGFKPLQRIAEAFGYDLHVILLPNEDVDNVNAVNQLNDQFLESADHLLDNGLSLPLPKGRRTSASKKAIDDYFKKFDPLKK